MEDKSIVFSLYTRKVKPRLGNPSKRLVTIKKVAYRLVYEGHMSLMCLIGVQCETQ